MARQLPAPGARNDGYRSAAPRPLAPGMAAGWMASKIPRVLRRYEPNRARTETHGISSPGMLSYTRDHRGKTETASSASGPGGSASRDPAAGGARYRGGSPDTAR